MMDSIKISIIVPMYNAEKTIETCVKSLVEQTYKNIEIIVVDDGSTDNSLKKIKAFSDKVKIIKKENGGVSSARNYGINNASGEYIAFCDSDDTYELNAIENLVSKGNQSDFIVGSVRKIFANRVENELVDSVCALDNDEIAACIVTLTRNFMINQMWGKLFRKNIIKENSVYFEESMSCGEDLDFVCRYCQCIKSLTFISDITYNYYLMEGSSSLSQKFYPNILVLIEQSNKELAKLYKYWKIENDGELTGRYIADLWNAINQINNNNCELSAKGKVKYIDGIIKSEIYKRNLKLYKKENFNKTKFLIMNLKCPFIIYFIINITKCLTKEDV